MTHTKVGPNSKPGTVAPGAKQPNWVPVPMQQAFDVRLHETPKQSSVGAIQDPLPSQ